MTTSRTNTSRTSKRALLLGMALAATGGTGCDYAAALSSIQQWAGVASQVSGLAAQSGVLGAQGTQTAGQVSQVAGAVSGGAGAVGGATGSQFGNQSQFGNMNTNQSFANQNQTGAQNQFGGTNNGGTGSVFGVTPAGNTAGNTLTSGGTRTAGVAPTTNQTAVGSGTGFQSVSYEQVDEVPVRTGDVTGGNNLYTSNDEPSPSITDDALDNAGSGDFSQSGMPEFLA